MTRLILFFRQTFPIAALVCGLLSILAFPVFAFGALRLSDPSQWKCSNLTPPDNAEFPPARSWFPPTTLPARAVAIVVHGLNNKPEVMNQIADQLQLSGIEVLRVGLTGHTGDIETMKTVTKEQWMSDIFNAYCTAHARSQLKSVPLYFVGFSLGGLLGEELLNANLAEAPHFDRVVLFAPAVSIRDRAYNVTLLAFMGESFIVPSAAPAEYRAQSGVSIAGYHALFALNKDVNLPAKSDVQNVPTLIFVDPQDELISIPKLQDYMKTRGLTQWSMQQLDTDKSGHERYHHLVIDLQSLGEQQWSSVISAIKVHFTR